MNKIKSLTVPLSSESLELFKLVHGALEEQTRLNQEILNDIEQLKSEIRNLKND